SFWLEALALEIDDKETTTYLALCDRILELESEKEEENMAPVNQAINHPMGRITTALLRRWYHTKPENNAGLTDETRQRFTRLCTPDICRERHGRVVLARHVISLFQVDPEWTQHYLLPFFDWAHPENAAGMWQAFLHSPRLHPPLLAALKPDFLATAKHCDHLGHHQDEYARFLTFSALDLNTGNIFSKPELKRAFATLPSEELATVADALFCAVNNADDQSASYWTHRVTPFLRNIWPQSTDGMPPEIAESFALACVAAGNAFPNALNQVKEWLRPLSWGSYQITDNILETTPSLIQRHPEEVLVLLDMIIGEQSQTSSKLEQCLIDIQSEKPDLKSDPRFERLQGMVRQD
ncbi:MAG: hypothetical protein OXC66_07730, partial [Roseovarius sp.]|nr:hypothetical protein [Roseovarius sp.]